MKVVGDINSGTFSAFWLQGSALRGALHCAYGARSAANQQGGDNVNGCKDFRTEKLKIRPESGLDWLVCAIFARQRSPPNALLGARVIWSKIGFSGRVWQRELQKKCFDMTCETSLSSNLERSPPLAAHSTAP